MASHTADPDFFLGVATMPLHGTRRPHQSALSGGLTTVVLQEPTEPFTTLDGAFPLAALVDRRQEQDIAFALMIGQCTTVIWKSIP